MLNAFNLKISANVAATEIEMGGEKISRQKKNNNNTDDE